MIKGELELLTRKINVSTRVNVKKVNGPWDGKRVVQNACCGQNGQRKAGPT